MPRQILLFFFYLHYSRNTFFCNFYILLSNRNCFSTCAVHFSSNPQSRYVSRLPLNHSIYFSPCFYWQQTRYNFFFCRMWYIKSYQNILLLHFPIVNGRLQVPCQPSGRIRGRSIFSPVSGYIPVTFSPKAKDANGAFIGIVIHRNISIFQKCP